MDPSHVHRAECNNPRYETVWTLRNKRKEYL